MLVLPRARGQVLVELAGKMVFIVLGGQLSVKSLLLLVELQTVGKHVLEGRIVHNGLLVVVILLLLPFVVPF